jgi:Pyridoxamine 5'-phosphate oxidase
MHPDDREVREFLTRSMVARVAVLAPSGRPFMTPLWFVCDRGRIHMPHAATGLATRYVSAQPAVVLLFDAERGGASKRTLRITGEATVRPGRGSLRVLARLVAKYYLSSPSRGLLRYVRNYGLVQRYYKQATGSVNIEVMPQTAEFLPQIVS